MDPILKKLGFKDQNPMLVLNAPEGFLKICENIGCTPETVPKGEYEFIVVFSEMQAQMQPLVADAARHFRRTGHFWACYPKGTSKNFKSDLNRNSMAEVMAKFELEPVSQVSIDDDWSAMRFRHADLIRTMARKSAYTKAGQARLKK